MESGIECLGLSQEITLQLEGVKKASMCADIQAGKYQMQRP